jgi:Tfp pilus assembly protein PilN
MMADVNMVPEQRQVRRRRRARTRLWLRMSGAYVTVMALALFFVHTVWKVDNAALAEDLNATVSRVKQYSSSMLRLRKELARISAILQTSRAIKRQPDWSKLLVILANTLDQDIVLNMCEIVTLDKDGREISGDQPEALTSQAVTSLLSARQYRLTLAGLGRQHSAVSKFAVQLEQSGLFDSVSLLNNQRQDVQSQSVIVFDIECQM